jgi:heme exporter protein D
MVLAAVGDGRIRGGWAYVWTAYGITWTALVLYTLSLWARWPREERK